MFYSASAPGGALGGTSFEGDISRRSVPVGPRQVPAGETDVRVTLSLPRASGTGVRTYRVRIDCANTPTRLAERRCDRLVRDRWALLLPQPADAACDGGGYGDPSRWSGATPDSPSSRSYGACYGGTVAALGRRVGGCLSFR